MTNPTIVEATSAIPNRGTLVITFTIQQDGSALNLTGKTPTATIRRESAPSTTINAALEDHAMTVTNAAGGICTLTLSNTELAYLSTPVEVTKAYSYLASVKVASDNYFPYLYRFWVHGVLD